MSEQWTLNTFSSLDDSLERCHDADPYRKGPCTRLRLRAAPNPLRTESESRLGREPGQPKRKENTMTQTQPKQTRRQDPYGNLRHIWRNPGKDGKPPRLLVHLLSQLHRRDGRVEGDDIIRRDRQFQTRTLVRVNVRSDRRTEGRRSQPQKPRMKRHSRNNKTEVIFPLKSRLDGSSRSVQVTGVNSRADESGGHKGTPTTPQIDCSPSFGNLSCRLATFCAIALSLVQKVALTLKPLRAQS